MRTHKTRGASGARPRRRNARGGTLIGIFIGLVLGVAIAFGIAWYINKTPVPFQNKAAKPPEGRPEARPPAAPAAPPGTPATLPGKPGDKPRFDFYKILPEGEQAVPAPAAAPKVETAAPAADALYLQAGAFQNPADADNLKAKLALMGLEASVVQVAVPEKGTVHRVRLGPFAKPEDMNRARKELAQNGIQAGVVKGK